MSNFTRHMKVAVGDGTTDGTTIPGIQKGDLFLVDENWNIITTNAAAAALPKRSKVKIALGVGTGKARFIEIEGEKTSKYTGKAVVSKSEQVTYLGFNGTDGAGIDSDSDTDYRLRININDDHRVGQRQSLIDVHYKTGANTTAAELASAIACLAVAKDYNHNHMENFLKVERVSDGTFTALTNNASVVNGSDIVVSTAHGASVGQAIRIGGTAATVPVYIVKEVIDANTIKLDVAYQGITNSALLAANIGTLTTITKWGFKLTGLEVDSKIYRTPNSPLDLYEWVNFDGYFTVAQDTEANAYTAENFTTKGTPGQGYWKQVAQAEELAKPGVGDQSKRNYYDQRLDNNVVVGTEYGSVVIEHQTDIGSFALESARGLQVAEIYLPTGSDQANAAGDNFLHILNGFFAGSVGFTAIPTL